jgi:hypothetical protein
MEETMIFNIPVPSFASTVILSANGVKTLWVAPGNKQIHLLLLQRF